MANILSNLIKTKRFVMFPENFRSLARKNLSHSEYVIFEFLASHCNETNNFTVSVGYETIKEECNFSDVKSLGKKIKLLEEKGFIKKGEKSYKTTLPLTLTVPNYLENELLNDKKNRFQQHSCHVATEEQYLKPIDFKSKNTDSVLPTNTQNSTLEVETLEQKPTTKQETTISVQNNTNINFTDNNPPKQVNESTIEEPNAVFASIGVKLPPKALEALKNNYNTKEYTEEQNPSMSLKHVQNTGVTGGVTGGVKNDPTIIRNNRNKDNITNVNRKKGFVVKTVKQAVAFSKIKLKQFFPNISTPAINQYCKEIVFNVFYGKLNYIEDKVFALNICFKLMKQDQWKLPIGIDEFLNSKENPLSFV